MEKYLITNGLTSGQVNNMIKVDTLDSRKFIFDTESNIDSNQNENDYVTEIDPYQLDKVSEEYEDTTKLINVALIADSDDLSAVKYSSSEDES